MGPHSPARATNTRWEFVHEYSWPVLIRPSADGMTQWGPPPPSVHRGVHGGSCFPGSSTPSDTVTDEEEIKISGGSSRSVDDSHVDDGPVGPPVKDSPEPFLKSGTEPVFVMG